MLVKRSAFAVLALGCALLASCSVSEHAYRVTYLSPGGSGAVRVWVAPDLSVSGAGEWCLWFDTVLWPIDAVASVACMMTRDDSVRVRGVVRKVAAVLLPGITAYHYGEVPLESAVLGLRDLGGEPIGTLSVPGGAIVQIREALVSALAQRASGADVRELIDSRIVAIEPVLGGAGR